MKINGIFFIDNIIIRLVPYIGLTIFRCSDSIDLTFQWLIFTIGIEFKYKTK